MQGNGPFWSLAAACSTAVGYVVTQNSGMKQSVQTTSKKSGGQKGLLKTRITCNTIFEMDGTELDRCLLRGLVAEGLERLQQCRA